MPMSVSRDLHFAARSLSSTGAGPSTLRARSGIHARRSPLTISRGSSHGRRYLSVDSTISSTFDTLQNTLEYPTTFVSHIINTSPIPTHGATIILLALFVRTVLTLPPTLWQRRQKDKMDSLIPELKAFEIKTAKRLIVPYRRQRNEKGFMEALEGEVGLMSYGDDIPLNDFEVKDEQRYLYKTNGIHPRLSRWGPIAFNLSLLITMSTAVRAAVSGPGNNIAQESFAWVSQLGAPDLPLSLTAGVVAFAIAELSGWQGKKKEEVTPALTSNKTPIKVRLPPPTPAPAPSAPSRPVAPPPPLSRPGTPPVPQASMARPSGPPRTVSRNPSSSQRPFSSSSISALPASRPATPTPRSNSGSELHEMTSTRYRAELLKTVLFNTMRVAAVGLVLLTSQMPAVSCL